MTELDIPFWKILISYIHPVHLESRESVINPDLYVLLTRGRIQLCTSNAVYSYEERYFNFADIFKEYLDLNKLKRGQTLLLGLGLGSIPYILDRIRPGFWDITAVEIDEQVCSLALKYTFPKLSSQIETIVTDASIFLIQNTTKYDLICVDLFIDDTIPEIFQEIKFLQNLKKALSYGGILIFNTLAYTQKDKNHSKEFFDNLFLKVFPKGRLIHAHKNYMLTVGLDNYDG